MLTRVARSSQAQHPASPPGTRTGARGQSHDVAAEGDGDAPQHGVPAQRRVVLPMFTVSSAQSAHRHDGRTRAASPTTQLDVIGAGSAAARSMTHAPARESVGRTAADGRWLLPALVRR